jgi:hypothetical protein
MKKTMMYLKCPFLPKIPSELIETDLSVIESSTRIYPYPSNTFCSWWIDDKLERFLQPHFNFPIQVRYQVIKNKLSKHVDDGRTFCYNYVVHSGGSNIQTRWFDEEEITEFVVMNEFEWYWLDVSVPHDLDQFVNYRLSISVKHAN